MGCAHLLSLFQFEVDSVDGDDFCGVRQSAPLDYAKADPSAAEHCHRGTGRDFGAVDDSSDTGDDAAGDETCSFEVGVVWYEDAFVFGRHRVFGEGWSAVVDAFTVFVESGRAVGHCGGVGEVNLAKRRVTIGAVTAPAAH